MVGASGFEPPASWSRTRRASQAALRPDVTHSGARKERPEWKIQNSIALRLNLESAPPARIPPFQMLGIATASCMARQDAVAVL